MPASRSSARTRRVALALAAVIAVAALATPVLGAEGSGRIVYLTDSGLEVTDASGGPVPDGNPFPNASTLSLPGVSLSAPGAASVTVDVRNGTWTNVSGVTPTHDITVNPDDKQAVVLEAGFDSLSFRAADYAGGGVDFEYSAGGEATLTVKSTGLSEGTTVEAVGGDGSTLASATVEADGSVRFTALPAGTETVDLVSVSGGSDGNGGGGGDTQGGEARGDDVTGEPTGSQQTEQGTQVTSRARNVEEGDRVSMDTSTRETTDDPVAIDRVSFTVQSRRDSVSVTVTQSTAPISGAPGFQSDKGTEPTGYVRIQHDIPNQQVSNVEITFRVSKDRLGPDEQPKDVALYRAAGGSYSELSTRQTGETGSHYVFTAESSGLSDFVVGIKQAQFRIADAAVSVAEVRVRERTEVVTRVTNTGGADGTFVVELVRGNETVAKRSLSIAANGTRRTTFSQSFESPGTYELFVNDVFVATVTVRAQTPTPTAAATPAADGGGGGTSVFSPGFGPVAAVLALLVAALAARRR